MLTGITLFGVITANLAARFVEHDVVHAGDSSTHIAELVEEVRALRETVDELRAQVTPGAAGGGPAT